MPGDAGGKPIDDGNVLVSEEIDWRNRALGAERRVEELEGQLGECETALAQARAALDEAELQRRIEQELIDAEALDLETARMLTEAAVSQMDEPDVGSAVAELKRRKPFLFGQGSRASAMSGHVACSSEAEDVAELAKATGDRGLLLRYLRLRRQ